MRFSCFCSQVSEGHMVHNSDVKVANTGHLCGHHNTVKLNSDVITYNTQYPPLRWMWGNCHAHNECPEWKNAKVTQIEKIDQTKTDSVQHIYAQGTYKGKPQWDVVLN